MAIIDKHKNKSSIYFDIILTNDFINIDFRKKLIFDK